jgi:glycosyltransferase involved in cell wall biosynthesis
MKTVLFQIGVNDAVVLRANQIAAAFAAEPNEIDTQGKSGWLGRRSEEKEAVAAFRNTLSESNPGAIYLVVGGPAPGWLPKEIEKAAVPLIAHIVAPLVLDKHLESLFAMAKRIVVPSSPLRKTIVERFFLDEDRFDLIPWPLDERFFVERDLAARKGTATRSSAKVLLCSGEFAEAAARAMVTLQKLDKKAVLWVLAEEDEALAELASKKRVDRRMRFLGDRSNEPGIYAAADLMLHLPAGDDPSEAEPVARALAAGLPCVATDCGAAPDLLLGTSAGAIVEPGSPAAVAKAASAYLLDEALYETTAIAARERARKALSSEAFAARLRALTPNSSP